MHSCEKVLEYEIGLAPLCLFIHIVVYLTKEMPKKHTLSIVQFRKYTKQNSLKQRVRSFETYCINIIYYTISYVSSSCDY